MLLSFSREDVLLFVRLKDKQTLKLLLKQGVKTHNIKNIYSNLLHLVTEAFRGDIFPIDAVIPHLCKSIPLFLYSVGSSRAALW